MIISAVIALKKTSRKLSELKLKHCLSCVTLNLHKSLLDLLNSLIIILFVRLKYSFS
jgi:hypothetical protein